MDCSKEIISTLNREYGLGVQHLELLRDWIGQVYMIKTQDSRYVLKLYKKKTPEEVLPSVKVVDYLYHRSMESKRGEGVALDLFGYKQSIVPQIIHTLDGDLYTTIQGSVAVLSEFIEGLEVDRDGRLEPFAGGQANGIEIERSVFHETGVLAGYIQKIMVDYQETLPVRDDSFFTKRYIDILEAKGYPHVEDFRSIGKKLWQNISGLQHGFMHGDFHAGNLFLRKGFLVVYDFDACGMGYPAYDIATMCDPTNYFKVGSNHFQKEREQLVRNLDTFLTGYSRYISMNQAEVDSIPYFIAIRHFDIQATIIDTLGPDCVDHSFLDSQLQWLNDLTAI